jgi:hypothetical protein
MAWNSLAEEILQKIKNYRLLSDDWQVCKKSADVTVWHRPSPDWKGTLYKAEGIVEADPETVFSFVDPSPSSPRCQWDKAIKQLHVIDQVDKNVSIMRTVTHSAFGGLISSRDFVDLVVNEITPDYLATSARWTEHPKCPPNNDCVRGANHPCSIICHRITGQPNQTRVTTYIQTDLAGMLPTSLVDSALPSNQVNFFTALKAAIGQRNKSG